ncbi:hypothetical protein RND71_003368 [Anisodus tanguticus]|uniref:Uncharacterized protein n=1 Tax=Anisodus tanguticus TaxID=243964 RepID=A0AAE1SXS2_9SOLA|nr:hypothetical protein RND71_003368 [Anisodus tanguticus]
MEKVEKVELIHKAIQLIEQETIHKYDEKDAEHRHQFLVIPPSFFDQGINYRYELLLDSLKEETPLDQMNQSTNMQETPSVNKVEEAEDDEVNREKEKVVKELKKIQKQNFITQCLLSAMIVLTVTWQLSEVSLILKMKDGLNHPLRSIGSMITGWIKRPPPGLNGKEGNSAKQLKHQVEAMCHSKIKVPELPHMEMLSLDFINEED